MSLLVPFAAGLVAFFSYRVLEEWNRKSWLPAGLRALGWALVALLLVNASCPGPSRSAPPLVVLDGSLSMQAAGGRWPEALALARQHGGELRVSGVPAGDTTPSAGRSSLAPDLIAAQGTGRPILLITDGEVEDAADILAQPQEGVAIRVLARAPVPDLAVTRVRGTTHLAPRDSLRLEVEVAGTGPAGARRVALEVREGERVWLRGSLPLDSAGRGAGRLEGPLPAVAPGIHILRIGLADSRDAEPRNDARLFAVRVAATPGVVLLASPPTWDSRFLAATLGEVAELPVRGYLEIEPGSWRRAGTLEPAGSNEVADAARRADLLVTLGAPPELVRGSRARARWTWLVTPSAASGDWYVTVAPASPLVGSLVGLPADSFPPGTALAGLPAGSGDWVALFAQLGRRGASHPVLIGRDSAGFRSMMTGIEGLWRWAFRGGASEQGYRALIASGVSWLLGGRDPVAGLARPEREVVPRGLPAVFGWSGGGTPRPLAIEWVEGSGIRRDTLIFDGMGRAQVRLPPGIWRYRLEGAGGGGGGGGGEGIVAVEEYSDEWMPRRVTLADREAPPRVSGSERPVRGWLWLFGLAVLAFAGEWAARRRLGLR